MGNVIKFPKGGKDAPQERVFVMMLYVPMGELTVRKANKLADGLAQGIMEDLDHVRGLEGSFYVAEVTDVN